MSDLTPTAPAKPWMNTLVNALTQALAAAATAVATPIAAAINAAVAAPTFVHISTNTTTHAKNAGGVFNGLTINTVGASGNTITIYDGLTAGGAVIAVIDGTVQASLQYNHKFSTGLCIVTANGTCADITVSLI